MDRLEDRQLLAPLIGLTLFNQLGFVNDLVRLDSTNPGVITGSTPVTGLSGNDYLIGIDYRPETTQLFGLGNSGRLYTLNPLSGAATAVGSGLTTPLDGSDSGFDLGLDRFSSGIGIDFNPTVDRIRIVSRNDQNLRANPDDGTNLVDGNLAYGAGDVNFGADPNVTAVAYANNVAGATSTTLYGIDTDLDTLVIQNPANAGTLTTIGPLGFDVSDIAGFDISGNSADFGTAYAVLRVPDAITSGLFTVDLATGAATSLGTIGLDDGNPDGGFIPGGAIGTLFPRSVIDVAAVPDISTFFAVDASNNLVRFLSVAPSVAQRTIPIVGLAPGEQVLGLDVRPAMPQIFALGSSGQIYVIHLGNGQAFPIGSPLTTALNGSSFGFDFNPTVDRIRITSDADQNLRANPNDGTNLVDGTLAYGAGDANFGVDPNVTASAYTNSVAGATTTTLYGIDTNTDTLVIQNPANAGTLATVGPLGIDVDAATGFDIVPGSKVGYALLTPAGTGTPALYVINLTTGAATRSGAVNASPLSGLAVANDGLLAIADADLVPPTVIDLVRFGFHFGFTTYVVSFSEPLDPATASNVNNYLFRTNGRDGIPGTADDRNVRLASAVYDDATRSVTLTPVAPRLRLQPRYNLLINAGPGGVTDPSGNFLDGDFDGAPGGTFSTSFGSEVLIAQDDGSPLPAFARSVARAMASGDLAAASLFGRRLNLIQGRLPS